MYIFFFEYEISLHAREMEYIGMNKFWSSFTLTIELQKQLDFYILNSEIFFFMRAHAVCFDSDWV